MVANRLMKTGQPVTAVSDISVNIPLKILTLPKFTLLACGNFLIPRMLAIVSKKSRPYPANITKYRNCFRMSQI
jgi:hypothetical protein